MWGVVAEGRAWATDLKESEGLGKGSLLCPDLSLSPGVFGVTTQAMEEEGR